MVSDKKTEKIARLISLVINKLEPTKILDEGIRLWDSLVEMKKNGDVFTHNELKNLQKIGRVLSDLKAKNPQYLNSSADVVEISCSKCKKSKCSVTQKQTRAGDEPPTTYITCLECGNVVKL